MWWVSATKFMDIPLDIMLKEKIMQLIWWLIQLLIMKKSSLQRLSLLLNAINLWPCFILIPWVHSLLLRLLQTTLASQSSKPSATLTDFFNSTHNESVSTLESSNSSSMSFCLQSSIILDHSEFSSNLIIPFDITSND